jgi:hypothetical protein
MNHHRVRERLIFETSAQMKRAVRIRAALEGVKPADIVNAGLRVYLDKELELVEVRQNGPRAKDISGRRPKEPVP